MAKSLNHDSHNLPQNPIQFSKNGALPDTSWSESKRRIILSLERVRGGLGNSGMFSGMGSEFAGWCLVVVGLFKFQTHVKCNVFSRQALQKWLWPQGKTLGETFAPVASLFGGAVKNASAGTKRSLDYRSKMPVCVFRNTILNHPVSLTIELDLCKDYTK